MLSDLGLDFEVGLRQSFIAGNNVVDGIPVQGKPVPNQFSICRIGKDGQGNEDAFPLGTLSLDDAGQVVLDEEGNMEADSTGASVTAGYQVIQQCEAFG